LERAGDGDEDGSGDDGDDEEEEDVFVDMQKADEENLTFEETLDQHIDTITEFANGLKYQRRFRDQRMLRALERDGGAFLQLAQAGAGVFDEGGEAEVATRWEDVFDVGDINKRGDVLPRTPYMCRGAGQLTHNVELLCTETHFHRATMYFARTYART
jgi:hypothetical protein